MLALSIASTGASVYAQSEQRQATNRSNDRQKLNVMAARDENIDESIASVRENNESAAQRAEEIRKEAYRQRATTRVAAAESGVAGLSVDALLRDLSGQEAIAVDSVNTNLERSNNQSAQRVRASNSAGASAIARLTPGANPDYLGAALRIGTATQRYSNRKDPR